MVRSTLAKARRAQSAAEAMEFRCLWLRLRQLANVVNKAGPDSLEAGPSLQISVSKDRK